MTTLKPAKGKHHPGMMPLYVGIAVLLILVLLAVPVFRHGMSAFLNRLFEISESRNAYRYAYLPAADPNWMVPAIVVLALLLLDIFLALARISRPVAGTLLLAGSAFVQAYLGISLPTAGNVILFLCGILLLIRPFLKARDGVFVLALFLIISLLVVLFRPGTDASVEQLSERVRDWFGQGSVPGETGGALPETVVETRHVNERSLDVGEREARGTEGYRLIQLDRMEISRPDWFSMIRIILPFIGVLLLLTVPFVPFILLNRQRQKTIERRKPFEDPDNRIAAAAMFRHVCDYLRATGHLETNAPYRLAPLPGMNRTFTDAFHEAAIVWERAVYSDHPIETAQRTVIEQLLEETEKRLYDQADRRQQFRLRTVECLHL